MTSPFGQRLRHWRKRRGWSQLALATRAQMSPRHLSFLETGRSRPGEAMVIRLADELDVPLGDRNDLLRAAGFAPAYVEREWSSDALAPFRQVVEQMLRRHAPFPAFVLNARWYILDANEPAKRLFPALKTPADALALFFAPGGYREVIENWEEIAWFSLKELRHDALRLEDESFWQRVAQVERWLEDAAPPSAETLASPVACPRLRIGDAMLSTFTTVARFGTAQDVTLDSLRVEFTFPADEATETFFQQLA